MTRLGVRRLSPIEWVARGAVILVLVGAPILALAGHELSSLAKARAWNRPGPPCPILSRAAYRASGLAIAHWFQRDDARIGRGYGYVRCDEIADHGGWGPNTHPVCLFNNPTVLAVVTSRGESYYFTQAQPATISLADQQPRCVMAAPAELLDMGPA